MGFQENKRVNVVIVGAMMCGITTLYGILNRHTDICCSLRKESDFFSAPHIFLLDQMVNHNHRIFQKTNVYAGLRDRLLTLKKTTWVKVRLIICTGIIL